MFSRAGEPDLESDHKMQRPAVTHVVILDGTLSSLREQRRSHAGMTFELLNELPASPSLRVRYEEGIQWLTWGSLVDVIAGRGLTQQIRRTYSFIASRYRPGDRIFLFGFSRGAYAVRSLAGVIDQIGLLRPECATERNIRRVFRFYRDAPESGEAQHMRRDFCHASTQIEMIGVWDTVKSLGIPYPLLWRLAPRPVDFHNHALGASTLNGFHALALHENRRAFTPVMWESRPDWTGTLEQVWFRGSHGDVGGFIGSYERARPLANISLVWMLDKAENCGLPLPEGWRKRFPRDANAPAHGTLRGSSKYFILRRARQILYDPSEKLHPSTQPGWVPDDKS